MLGLLLTLGLPTSARAAIMLTAFRILGANLGKVPNGGTFSDRISGGSPVPLVRFHKEVNATKEALAS